MSITISGNSAATAITCVQELSEHAKKKKKKKKKYNLRRFMKRRNDVELSLMYQRCEKLFKPGIRQSSGCEKIKRHNKEDTAKL